MHQPRTRGEARADATFRIVLLFFHYLANIIAKRMDFYKDGDGSLQSVEGNGLSVLLCTARRFRRNGVGVPAQRHRGSGATGWAFRRNGTPVPAQRRERAGCRVR